MDFEKIAKKILSVFDVKEFQECDLLNMVLIATSELTADDSEINYPHFYTITRCINAVLGKNTRGRRGTKTKISAVKNEGILQDSVEKCIANHSTLFTEGIDLAKNQDIKDSPRTTLKGYGLNQDNIITLGETAYLRICILSKKSEGACAPASINEAIKECIEMFHGNLSKTELAEKEDDYRDNTLSLLIRAKYFYQTKNKWLGVPSSNRSVTEEKYLKYLMERALQRKKNKEILNSKSKGE